MVRTSRCSCFPRRVLRLALALAVLGHWSAGAGADPLPPGNLLYAADPVARAVPALPPAPPADPAEPPPRLRFDDAPRQLFALEPSSPGLLFSVDPDNEEVFFGWRFGF